MTSCRLVGETFLLSWEAQMSGQICCRSVAFLTACCRYRSSCMRHIRSYQQRTAKWWLEWWTKWTGQRATNTWRSENTCSRPSRRRRRMRALGLEGRPSRRLEPASFPFRTLTGLTLADPNCRKQINRWVPPLTATTSCLPWFDNRYSSSRIVFPCH